MIKELLENLLIEFDEMGFEPTTLCDNQREVDSFRNRLHQALIKSQENEKVLKIIFEKGLSLTERDMIKQSENYEQYQIKISWWNYKPFAIPKSKEEFDLLKRYFNEEKD